LWDIDELAFLIIINIISLFVSKGLENVNSAFDSSLNFAQIWRQNFNKNFDENIRERRLLGSLLLCDLDYYYWISPVI
jgi:hypothetical protein